MPSPFDAFTYKSDILEDKKDPFAGLGGPPVDAPTPPARPGELKQPDAASTQEPHLSWSDVPGKAWENAIPSAKKTALGMVEPFLSPLETGKALYGIGEGLYSKGKGALGYEQDPVEKEKVEAPVNAIGRFYADRYGSEEGLKKALAEDPVGVVSDASAIIGGGGTALAKAPGIAGKVGEVVQATGRGIHPINFAATVASPALGLAQKLLNYPLALKTGAPKDVLDQAMKAGFKGSEAFKRHFSGEADPAEIVQRAHDAVETLAQKRRSDYLSSMEGMKANTKLVDYTPINQAIVDAFKDVRHGVKTYRPEAEAMLMKIGKAVQDWQRKPNHPHINDHNLEGVDKLKQLVGEMRSSAMPGSPADKAATQIYNAIRNTLAKHDPNYLKAMGDYGDATAELKQMRQALSINPKAPVETTLRKLLTGTKQSDGSRAKLLEHLSEIDPEIPDMISGHLLHSWRPVGFAGNIGAALSMAPHALEQVASGAADPTLFALNAAASSPLVAGAMNYGVGRLAHPGGGLPLWATGGANVLSATGRQPSPAAQREERPFFPGPGEKRPGRASGGRTGMKAKSAQMLIAAVKRAKKEIQSQTEAILSQPDEHVVRALAVANEKI